MEGVVLDILWWIEFIDIRRIHWHSRNIEFQAVALILITIYQHVEGRQFVLILIKRCDGIFFSHLHLIVAKAESIQVLSTQDFYPLSDNGLVGKYGHVDILPFFHLDREGDVRLLSDSDVHGVDSHFYFHLGTDAQGQHESE